MYSVGIKKHKKRKKKRMEIFEIACMHMIETHSKQTEAIQQRRPPQTLDCCWKKKARS